ncbi:MAG: hypothetical protein LKI32_07295 [Lachnospiraceae bacterium]|jgi:uncharacterized protein YciI|nr:hypothetical protein [Lachnospiraceae bacterium]MCI1657346.1 hypothetical protein [Lachnospiraceae bacterium]MCI2195824.1 hypothetical protein [Lachnospiraceae bacterium]
MKFIKISEHRPEFFSYLKEHPESLAGPLKEHIAWMKDLQEKGTLVDAYFLPGDGRCITIWDFKDESEVDNNILQDPMELEFTAQFFPAVPLFEHMNNAMNRKE